MENVIEIKGVTKSYKGFKLGEIDVEIPMGFSTALIGANGAGKTTLLDIICGITVKKSGEIKYFGEKTDIDDEELTMEDVQNITDQDHEQFFDMVEDEAASDEDLITKFLEEEGGD